MSKARTPAGLRTQLFRADELVVLLPPRHRMARAHSALRFADLLGQDWIGLNAGAAVLIQQQQVAAAAGRPLRLRMQVRSFDAACHMVAAGLGLALLPRASVQAMAGAMHLGLRPLADGWARRRLLLATRDVAVDPVVQAVVDFLAQPGAPLPDGPSQNAKTRGRKAQ